MDNRTKASNLLALFKTLRAILVAEGEGNWLRGIDLIIDALTPPQSGERDFEEALRYAESTYKSMLGGSGSFSEFYIWRDDFDERVKENDMLEKIKNDIWDTFG
jgi:hypothetical protein